MAKTKTVLCEVLIGMNLPPDDTRYEPGDEVRLAERRARPLIKAGALRKKVKQ